MVTLIKLLVSKKSESEKESPDRNYDWFWLENKYLDILPELDELFSDTVLNFLSINRSQKDHREKKERVTKKLGWYTAVSGWCGITIAIIGAGRLVWEDKFTIWLTNLIANLTSITTPFPLTINFVVTFFGFVTAACSILQKKETYLERAKDIGTILEKERFSALEFKIKLMNYKPKKDKNEDDLIILQSDFSALKLELQGIDLFRLLSFKELTQDEKRQAVEYKSAWYNRLSRYDRDE